jgi:hypothetical protein
VTEGRARRRKQLLNDLREIIGYWKLKEEALDHNLWRIALEETTDLSKDIRRMICTKKVKAVCYRPGEA